MTPMGRRSFLGWLAITGVGLPKALRGSSLASVALTSDQSPASSDAINVKNYGAVGNGTHDDTSAIQRALAAGVGQEVWLPPGTYLVRRSIIVPERTTLFGSGAERTTIMAASGGIWKAPSPANWVFVVGAVNSDGVTVRDLAVDANNQMASGICILGGDSPSIMRTFASAAVHSGIHFFGKQTANVLPVTNGLMLANKAQDSRYNIVCDGQNENIQILGNISLDPGITHYSLDGSQGGDGNFNLVLDGNQAVGNKNGAGNTFLCYVNHGTLIVGNSARDSITGRGGRDGQHFNIQESSDVLIADNVLRTSSPADYPAWGVAMGASQVTGRNNIIDGVHTGFYLIGTSDPPTPFRDTVLLNAKEFMTTNYPKGSYQASYDFGGAYFNGARYQPRLTPVDVPVRSGVMYGNPFGLPITIYLPAHASKAGKSGRITVAAGPLNPPPDLFAQRVSHEATSAIPDTIIITVPAAGYYKVTMTGAEVGTPTIIGN